MKFKSEFFKNNILSAELIQKISSDIDYLLSTDLETINFLLSAFLTANFDSTYFINLLSDEVKCDKSEAAHIAHSFRLISSLALAESAKNDSVEDWADDFIALEIIEDSQKEKYVEIVNYIKEGITPEFKTKARVNTAENGWMPYLTSVHTTTELRAVSRNTFSAGDDISKYDADIIDVVGMISVRVSVDDGDPNVLHFQAGRKNLKAMINTLNASLIELDALERFIKVKE